MTLRFNFTVQLEADSFLAPPAIQPRKLPLRQSFFAWYQPEARPPHSETPEDESTCPAADRFRQLFFPWCED